MAAGGNPFYLDGIQYPDIREARKAISEKGLWPSNLIVVGFEANESGQKVPASLGADIYVSLEDLKSLGFSGASSYATPVITEIIRQIEKVCKVDESGKKILFERMALDKEITDGITTIEYKLLDLPAVKAYLTGLKGKNKSIYDKEISKQ